MTIKVGVLAIQGAYHKHQHIIQSLGYQCILVKNQLALNIVDALIMPGGESTAMLLMLKKHHLWAPLKDFCQHKPVFGTCAGAILLAKEIVAQPIETLAIMDMAVARNSYGRQIESFQNPIKVQLDHSNRFMEAVFIRAPKIVSLNHDTVEVLAEHNHSPVLVRQSNKLACTFHPELTKDFLIHQYFLKMI